MKKISKWAEPVSKLPSRTRQGEAQTAEQLFKMFGMDIPVVGNPDEEYEFDITKDSMEDMFETKRNEVVDHRELLDIMEQEFTAHSSPTRTEAVSSAQQNPPKEDSEKGKAQDNPPAPEPTDNNEVV